MEDVKRVYISLTHGELGKNERVMQTRDVVAINYEKTIKDLR